MGSQTLADGLVHVTDASGNVTTYAPAVGVPATTDDGGTIVNLGNGSFTYTNSIGNTVTLAYPAGTAVQPAGAGLPSWALIAGAALAAFALLRG